MGTARSGMDRQLSPLRSNLDLLRFEAGQRCLDNVLLVIV